MTEIKKESINGYYYCNKCNALIELRNADKLICSIDTCKNENLLKIENFQIRAKESLCQDWINWSNYFTSQNEKLNLKHCKDVIDMMLERKDLSYEILGYLDRIKTLAKRKDMRIKISLTKNS